MTALNSVGPRMTRRVVLAGSAFTVVGLISGCRSEADPPSATPSSSNAAGTDSSATPVASGPANEALVAVTATRQFVQEMGDLFLGLRPRVTRIVNLHVAHEELLQKLTGVTRSASPESSAQPAVSRKQAERNIRAAESRLADTLSDLSSVADDGPLARALASMSAGTSQTAASAGWGTAIAPTPSLPQSAPLSAEETLAVQEVLAREHASLWWYGVLGGRTSAAQQPGLVSAITVGYDAHRRQRDQLTAVLVNQGVEPVAAEPTYPIDWNLRSGPQNVKQVHQIEHDAAAAYSWLVAEATGDLRSWAGTALRNAAIRDLAVQGTPENFPGADELADH